MTEIRPELHAFRHGDGYLTVSTSTWLSSHGTYDEDLTEDLGLWVSCTEQRYATERTVRGWAMYRSGGQRPVGLYGDDDPWSVCLPNVENFLTEEIGFVALSSDATGDIVVVTASDGGYYRRDPAVYRSTEHDLTSWMDYDTALAWCPDDHRWRVEEANRLVSEDGSGSHGGLLHTLVRVPDEDDRDRAYVACPACDSALTFMLSS